MNLRLETVVLALHHHLLEPIMLMTTYKFRAEISIN